MTDEYARMKAKEDEWLEQQIEREKFEIQRAKATCVPEDKQ